MALLGGRGAATGSRSGGAVGVLLRTKHFHGRGQIPDLNRSVGMTGEEEATGTRAHPRGALVFVDGEGSDGTAIDGSDGANPVPVGTQSHEHLTCLRNYFLNEDLSVVPLAIRTVVVA